MKAKKIKHIDDIIEQYISLQDEQIEIPLLIEKVKEKYLQHVADNDSNVYKPAETEVMFKMYTQVKKHEERQAALNEEIAGVESMLKDFLNFLHGGKVTYEKKDDNNKSKSTFLFWLEDGKIMSNR